MQLKQDKLYVPSYYENPTAYTKNTITINGMPLQVEFRLVYRKRYRVLEIVTTYINSDIRKFSIWENYWFPTILKYDAYQMFPIAVPMMRGTKFYGEPKLLQISTTCSIKSGKLYSMDSFDESYNGRKVVCYDRSGKLLLVLEKTSGISHWGLAIFVYRELQHKGYSKAVRGSLPFTYTDDQYTSIIFSIGKLLYDREAETRCNQITSCVQQTWLSLVDKYVVKELLKYIETSFTDGYEASTHPIENYIKHIGPGSVINTIV